MAQTTTPVDWTTESGYWRSKYKTRPYATAGRDYEFYEPGYRYGFESADQYRGRSWSDVQADLERGWENYILRGKLAWNGCRARFLGSCEEPNDSTLIRDSQGE